MKKGLSLILILALCLALCACSAKDAGSNEPTTDTTVYKIGDTVETDILSITLNNAQFAIKLNGSASGTLDQIQSGQTKLSDEYFTAEEYDPETDAGLAYVAAKGHTYVAVEYFATNLDRASVEFDGSFNPQFMGIEYAGESYTAETNYGCRSENGYQWERYNSSNVLLIAGEAYYYRCYIDIPTDVQNLDDDFYLVFSLPTSNGKTQDFKFLVKAQDRAVMEDQEMPVDEAIYSFTEQEGQDYFKAHMNEYTALSGSEITQLVKNRKWDMVMKLSYGSWTGAYKFEENGRILETIPGIGTGYYNDCTWSVDADRLILDGEEICEVRKINDSNYLLVLDGAPYAIMK